MIMENKIREKLEPKIREKSSYLRTFTFTKLYFGQKVSAALERAARACCAASFLLPPPYLRQSPIGKDLTGPQRGTTSSSSELPSSGALPLPVDPTAPDLSRVPGA